LLAKAEGDKWTELQMSAALAKVNVIVTWHLIKSVIRMHSQLTIKMCSKTKRAKKPLEGG